MAKFDISTVGITAGNVRARVAASATRSYVGEPLMTTPTYSSGTTNTNTVTAVTDNKPTIGTDDFQGICAKDFTTTSATDTTIVAHYTSITRPIPYATLIRGRVETTGNIDTQTELTGVLFDLTRFHLASSAYRIQAGGEADAGGLQIADGNTSRGTVDCWVDARAFRSDVS